MRTKGKAEIKAYGGGWTGISVGRELLFKLHLNNEANAEHLVSCWNAFEPDGLVSKLVGALEISKVTFQLIHEHHTKPRQIRGNTSVICETAIIDIDEALALAKKEVGK